MKLSNVLEKSGYDVEGKTRVVSDAGSNRKKRRTDSVGDGSQSQKNKKKRWEQASEGWDERLLKSTSFSRELAESFKMLRSQILYPGEGKTAPKTIMITSAAPGEGKSFIAANLAITLAHGLDQHSLLVGCDLRRPSLAALLGVNPAPGLADYLQNSMELSEVIRHTSVKKLSLLPSGKPPANPAELLSSVKMGLLVEELSNRYEDRLVIFDSPPLHMASESSVLIQHVDAVVMAVRYGVSGKNSVKKAVEHIGKDKLIGVLFNGHRSNPIEDFVFRKEQDGYYSYYGSEE